MVWTRHRVIVELVAAQRFAQVAVKSDAPRGIHGSFPETAVEFSDQVGQVDKGTLLKRPHGPPRRSFTSAEASAAEEALTWQARFLRDQPGQARVLKVWLLCKVSRRKFRKELKARGWPAATAYRRRDQAILTIVKGLNAAAVASRDPASS